MALSPKEKSFVKEYLIDKNSSRAARDAGYTVRSAHDTGSRLLRKAEVAKAVAQGLADLSSKAELKASDVLAEIRKLAFVDLSQAYAPDGKLLHPQQMPDDVRASLQSVETEELFVGRGKNKTTLGATRKIKLADKVRSLEMLAKHFKLLTEMHEHSGKDGGPQVVLHLFENGSESTNKVESDKPFTTSLTQKFNDE